MYAFLTNKGHNMCCFCDNIPNWTSLTFKITFKVAQENCSILLNKKMI